MPHRLVACLVLFVPVFAGLSLVSVAQDNYEIQVYGADLVKPHQTMLELHSNFTVDGAPAHDGMFATDHAQHETVEITHGFTDYFETGFYIFTSIHKGIAPNHGYRWSWVGDHIRPRFKVPDSWHWPVGVSISQEIGYQRSQFSPDTWTYEFRPIVDKQMGRFYWAINPSLERSLHGANSNKGFEFSPNVQVGWDFTPKINGAVEYYGALGPITGFDPLHDQQQQVFPSINLNLSPEWEFNFGVGVGMTANTDHLIVKMILGRRFNF